MCSMRNGSFAPPDKASAIGVEAQSARVGLDMNKDVVASKTQVHTTRYALVFQSTSAPLPPYHIRNQARVLPVNGSFRADRDAGHIRFR